MSIVDTGAPRNRVRTWFRNTTEAKAEAVAALAASTQKLAEAEGTLMQTRARTRLLDQRLPSPDPAPVPPRDAAVKVRWTFSKVVWALGLGAFSGGLWAGLALLSIAWQTGFLESFLARFPEFVDVAVPFFATKVHLPQWAPIGAELVASCFALMTVALVLQHKSPGRVHRAMWGISIVVAVSNGWHIGSTTDNLSLGLLYGGFSIVGPWLLHEYVLFLHHLRSTATGFAALQETASGLATFLHKLVSGLLAVLRVVVGVLLHPLLTAEYISQWSRPGATFERSLLDEERRLRLTLESKRRRVELLRGVRSPVRPAAGAAPPEIPIRVRKKAKRSFFVRFFSWLPWVSSNSQSTIEGMGVHHPSGSVPPDRPTGDPRTDTSLPGAIDDGPRGGVLTTFRGPEDDRNGDHDAAPVDPPDTARAMPADEQAVLEREFAAALDDEAAVLAELDELVRTLGSHAPDDESHGGVQPTVQPGDERATDRDTGRAEDRANGSHGDVRAGDGDRATDRDTDRATGPEVDSHGGVQPHGERATDRADRRANGSHGDVQAGDSDRATNRDTDRASSVTSSDTDRATGSHGQRATGSHDDGPLHADRATRREPDRASPPHGDRATDRDTVSHGGEQLHAERASSQDAGSHGGVRSDRATGSHAERATTPEDTAALSKAALIAFHYYKLLDEGVNVAELNRAEIARDLGFEESTVRRYWAQCVKGERGRPALSGSASPAGEATPRPDGLAGS